MQRMMPESATDLSSDIGEPVAGGDSYSNKSVFYIVLSALIPRSSSMVYTIDDAEVYSAWFCSHSWVVWLDYFIIVVSLYDEHCKLA